MKSVFITRQGGPEVLESRESPDPDPAEGQVRVRVKAAGVNFADILMRMGLYPGAPKTPFVPGYEAAGVIDRLGPGVMSAKEGDQVVVPTDFGGYTDTLVVPAFQVFPIPPGKSFNAAAALTVNYLTAYEALIEQGNLRKSGGRILVHGAAGGVGIAAAQIAKIYGAEVFGTASASKHEFLRKQGVAHPIDYRKEDFERVIKEKTKGRGVHVAMDPIGGKSFAKSYRSLAASGKLIVYGFSAAATGPERSWLNLAWQYLRTPRFSPFDMMGDNRGVIGLHLGRMTAERELLTTALRQLVAWWGEGKLEPVVGAAFPAAMAHKAHEYIQGRENIGKVVLTFE
ncbi:MAG: zinc-binding dehydrogenase [Elusimicrobiota bacterium]